MPFLVQINVKLYIIYDSVDTEINVEPSVQLSTTVNETSEVFTPEILQCFSSKGTNINKERRKNWVFTQICKTKGPLDYFTMAIIRSSSYTIGLVGHNLQI